MKTRLLPLVGIFLSIVLFEIAAFRYPGGYVWTRDFLCTLFAASTPSGTLNDVRFVAIGSLFVFCVSVAVLFKLLSLRAGSPLIANTLEIGGIGSMVYGFLVVTPMHDLLMFIALLFFLPAKTAALSLALQEGRRTLFWLGLPTLGLLLMTAGMYYGEYLWHLLPIAQKVSILACTGWLSALQLARVKLNPSPDETTT